MTEPAPLSDDALHVTLLRPPTGEHHTARQWTGAAATLFTTTGAPITDPVPYQVVGGPGTGKTSLLIDLACAYCRQPEHSSDAVLLLTQSKRAAATLSEEVATQLVGSDGLASQQPLIRTVHSYAYSLLARIAAAEGAPAPKLLTGAEKDVIYREMLETIAEDETNLWPEWIRPALTTVGFARELRDLISRAAERGLDGAALRALGEDAGEPAWVAAGQFATDFERIQLLRASVGAAREEEISPALDAAELVGAVLEGLATHPDILARERQRLELLLVDDAHHLDPQMAELIDTIRGGAQLTVLAGDPDQMVFRFRGADSSYFHNLAPLGSSHRIVLSSSYRLTPRNAEVVRVTGSRLPDNSQQWRELTAARSGTAAPAPTIHLTESIAAEAATVADVVRRAHLIDNVPWSDIAIICRSVGPHLPSLRRALAAAGVPLRTDAADLPLTEQYAADGILAVLEAVSGACDSDVAEKLLTGVVGRADPADVRSLRRGLRRTELARGGRRDSGLLLTLLLSPTARDTYYAEHSSDIPLSTIEAGLTDFESKPLQQVHTVVDAAWRAVQHHGTVEEVLWEAWNATGLADSWRVASLRGGVAGAQADRNLDAMMALFDAASDYVDRIPTGTVASFVRYIREQELPSLPRIRSLHTTDAVTIISATSAAGREWDTVIVPGIQEDEWPTLAVRGSLLKLNELLDRIAGVAPDAIVSRRAPQLADERRLLYVALSRARRSLVLTAVSGDGADTLTPSRFLEDVAEVIVPPHLRADEDSNLPTITSTVPCVLSMPTMVARLRSIVCATAPFPTIPPEEWDSYQQQAFHQLVRLAQAGVPGALNWWGVDGITSDDPLWTLTTPHATSDTSPQSVTPLEPRPVTLSPSAFETLQECPLRWFLSRNGGDTAPGLAAQFGTLIHALTQASASGVAEADLRTALDESWPALGIDAAWLADQEKTRAEEALANYATWNATESATFTLDGLEVGVDHIFTAADLADYGISAADLAAVDASTIPVRVKGRIDRLERTDAGHYVIVDFKTGKTLPSKAATADNAQLALYQLAVSATKGPVAKAKLVYLRPRGGTLGEREQHSFDAEQQKLWRLALQTAASATSGPTFQACRNDHCAQCAVRESCPLQSQSVLTRKA